MGMRSRLFASAAFPLLSLSLAFEPAMAAVQHAAAAGTAQNGIAVSTADSGDTLEMAQAQTPDAQSEEELKKHKKPSEQEGQKPEGQKPEGQKPEGQKPEGQKREAAPAQQGGAEPQHKAQPAAQPNVEPAQQKPNKQPEATQPAAVPHKQPAEQPQAQPEATPQPKAVQHAAPQTEQQAQPEPKKHQPNAEQPQAKPEATQPKTVQPQAAPQTQEAQPEPKKQPQAQPEATPQPKAVQQQQTAPAGQQTAPDQKKHQNTQGQATEPAQKPAGQQAAPAQQAPVTQQPQGQQAQPGTKVQPGAQAQPETQVQPGTQTQPENQATPGKQHNQNPNGDKTHGKPGQTQQQEGQQPTTTPQQQPAQKTEPQGQPQQAAPQTGQQQPNPATATPVQGKGTQTPANAPAQQNQQTAAPAGGEQLSPQELERRKKIAENPAASNETVVLPVQNGAAVLDSDKDAARRGHHQGDQGQGGQRPGGQGQAGQGQVGQGQAGQGQAGQAPQNQAPPPAYAKTPTSDAEAQRALGGQQAAPVKIEAVTSEQGRRLDRRPDFAPPEGTVVPQDGNQGYQGNMGGRVILNIDNNFVVRHDDTERFVQDGERPVYEQLPRDRFRETIDRPDGERIVTVRNRYGDIIQRSRIDADGREYVLFYSPELEDQPDHDDYFRDPGDQLPPMRLRIPLNQYIIDTGTDRQANYYDFLREPPVEPVERVYSLNEVRYSARIRDKVRRIDLDTITFATASAEIPMSQASTLRGVADAIGQIVKRDPSETFLIEGHTDAVGSPQSNLVLSDQRAESVAKILTDVYGVPPENLVTQGYGEQYLKVNTQGPEQENRRVTIRRVTALVRPVASNQ